MLAPDDEAGSAGFLGGFKDMMVALPDVGHNWIFLVS